MENFQHLGVLTREASLAEIANVSCAFKLTFFPQVLAPFARNLSELARTLCC